MGLFHHKENPVYKSKEWIKFKQKVQKDIDEINDIVKPENFKYGIKDSLRMHIGTLVEQAREVTGSDEDDGDILKNLELDMNRIRKLITLNRITHDQIMDARACIHGKLSKKVMERDKFTCVKCHKKLDPEKLGVEFIIDPAKGGLPVEENLVTMCLDCKGLKPVGRGLIE